MKKFSKILSFCLSFSIVASYLSTLPKSVFVSEQVTVSAAYENVSEYPDFDFDTYIADLWTNSKKDSVSYRMLDYYINESESPSTILYEPLKNDKAFQLSVAAWKTANFSAGSTADDMFDEIGYYEAIILKILKCEVNQTYIDETFKGGFDIAKRGVSIYKSTLKTEYFFDFMDDYYDDDFDLIPYEQLNAQQKEAVMDTFENTFKLDFPVTTYFPQKSSKCVIISPKQSISPHFLKIATPNYYLFTTVD